MTSASGNNKVTKKDLSKVFWRTSFVQASLNFERLHGLGFTFCMEPVLKRLYPENNPDRKAAIKRSLDFFNSQPYMDAVIIGVNTALEEQKQQGADISEETLSGIKVGMMGPLAGIGDPIWWGTIRPLVASICAGLAMSGNVIAPLLFFVVYNLIRLGFLKWSVDFGYAKGTDVVSNMADGTLQKITTGASVLGLFVMGALVNAWVNIKMPLTLMTTVNPETNEISVVTLQSVVDQLVPGLVPLLLTLLCMKLLKKNVKPIHLIFIFFAVSMIGYALGILG